MSFMRNEDFNNAESKTNGGQSNGRYGSSSYNNDASPTNSTEDKHDARQKHNEKLRERERTKGKSRMGGILARASAKPGSGTTAVSHCTVCGG